MLTTLRWRQNGRDSVSDHQPHDCLVTRLFRRRSKKTSKLRVTGLCVGNSPGTGEFPAQMASNAENVSIWLSHTWVRYPGFSGHEVKCPILTTVVPGFSGDLIGCTIRSKWGSFGDLYLARKNRLWVWNKLFLAEIKFSQRRTRPVKSLWWQIDHMQESTYEWKNLTIF